jgi:hypothetical protein
MRSNPARTSIEALQVTAQCRVVVVVAVVQQVVVAGFGDNRRAT